MKIKVRQIPFEGLVLEETISPQSLDLETDEVRFRGNIKIRAVVSRITNALAVKADLTAPVRMRCSRCLADVDIELKKKLELNYQVSTAQETVDIDQDIREEIILDYPMHLLCKPDCKGLCPRCGGSLNEGGCICGST
ncbi:MAG: DUF177 domain-containing protein [Candidatus Omnitrophota bacterium]